jgi:hypothetical protein
MTTERGHFLIGFGRVFHSMRARKHSWLVSKTFAISRFFSMICKVQR